MYGLPKDFDGRFLIGRTLEQICFNQNQIAFHFDCGVSITVEGQFAYLTGAPAGEVRKTDVPVAQSDLMQLLGRAIAHADAAGEGTLALYFENGHRLLCLDDPHYESYQIRQPGHVIIV